MRMWLCVVLLLTVGGAAYGQGDWKVQGATVRFKVRLNSAPTHPTAGYVVQLPDGGTLPRPAPDPRVFAADGTEVKSFVLWQNGQTGLGLVFEAPGKPGDVTVYVGMSGRLRTWTPASGLTPSAMLCTQSGAGTKRDATALAAMGPVDEHVHFRNHAGIPKAPLSVPGDLSGRQGPCALYLLAHVDAVDPGSTWVAPIVFDGETEVRIDGKALQLKKEISKPGGTGDTVELGKGLHRLEIFCWARNSNAQNGLMTLTWRTPNTSMQEMGGKRESDLPHPGTSMWASRPLRGNEIVRSGDASVVSAEGRDGGPVARFSLDAQDIFWLGNETPLLVYGLKAETAGNPADTRYTWQLDGGRVNRPAATWLFLGGRDHTVTLLAESGGRRSTCAAPFFPFTTRGTSLDNPASREAFRRAALEEFEAYPASQDPTAGWTDSHWNNFFRTLELDKGQALLTHIFQVRWDTLSRKLSADQRRLLQDVFLDFLPRAGAESAIGWTEKLEKQARDPFEAGMLQILRAEIYLYYLNDATRAKDILDNILSARRVDELSEWARIRCGDLEFHEGRMNEATALYAEVQNRAAKRLRLKGGGSKAALDSGALSAAELREALRGGEGRVAAGPGASEKVADWKVDTLLDAAASENVKSLVAQGYLLEAKRALRNWERDFPLSKVSGDYLLNEARLLMALGDWKKAEALLDPYCEQIDASSYIAPATEALLECKQKLRKPAPEIVAFCEKMKKKLEFHPVAEKINRTLSELKAAGKGS
jgi:hypothetical protein